MAANPKQSAPVSEAFQQGYTACIITQLSKASNPYEPCDPEFSEWDSGFDTAVADCENAENGEAP